MRRAFSYIVLTGPRQNHLWYFIVHNSQDMLSGGSAVQSTQKTVPLRWQGSQSDDRSRRGRGTDDGQEGAWRTSGSWSGGDVVLCRFGSNWHAPGSLKRPDDWHGPRV